MRPMSISPVAARKVRLESLEHRTLLAFFNPLVAAADGAVNSLRAAIIAANANAVDDTITLQTGTYELTLANLAGQENAAATGDLDVTDVGRSLTIRGQGASRTKIDANQIDRVFQLLPGVSVTLKDLTVTGGLAVDDGTSGALPGTTFAVFGGGILSDANLTLYNVSIRGNVANGADGADGASPGVDATDGQNAWGGGLFLHAGTTSIQKVTVENNAARAGDGGAGGDGVATNGTDGGNGGQAGGGGIYFASLLSPVLTISDSKIKGNDAVGGNGGEGGSSGLGAGGNAGAGGDARGGGIYAIGALTLNSTSVTYNEATAGDGALGGDGFTGAGLSWAGGRAEGGGIWITLDRSRPAETNVVPVPVSGALALNNSEVSNNVASGGDGGAGGDSTPGGATNGDDGGLGLGGGIYSAGPTVYLSNTKVKTNRALSGNGGAGGSGATAGNGGSGNFAVGGGLFASNAVVTLKSSEISWNGALAGDGGAGGSGASDGGNGGFGGTALAGGVYSVGPITMSKTSVNSNIAAGGDGGAGTSGSVTGGDGGRGGDARGGGIFTNSPIVIKEWSHVDKNQANGGDGGAGGASLGLNQTGGAGGDGGVAQGGGVYVDTGMALRPEGVETNSIPVMTGSLVTLDNSTANNNKANGGDGGAGGNATFTGSGGDGGEAAGGGLLAINPLDNPPTTSGRITSNWQPTSSQPIPDAFIRLSNAQVNNNEANGGDGGNGGPGSAVEAGTDLDDSRRSPKARFLRCARFAKERPHRAPA